MFLSGADHMTSYSSCHWTNKVLLSEEMSAWGFRVQGGDGIHRLPNCQLPTDRRTEEALKADTQERKQTITVLHYSLCFYGQTQDPNAADRRVTPAHFLGISGDRKRSPLLGVGWGVEWIFARDREAQHPSRAGHGVARVRQAPLGKVIRSPRPKATGRPVWRACIEALPVKLILIFTAHYPTLGAAGSTCCPFSFPACYFNPIYHHPPVPPPKINVPPPVKQAYL